MRGRRPRDIEEGIDAELDCVATAWGLHPYPWAGANSTHHTFLHFLEYGPRVIRSHFPRTPGATQGTLPLPPISHIGGMREMPRSDVERIERNFQALLSEYLRTALSTTIPSRGRGGSGAEEVAPLTAGH